ncbi:hypothetical protein Rhe02_98010 [Rhizocola hellebori]|uniref:Uncharacterized protein n=1 Tax=Rhizocola hellebori TaxID=1392758 RepID=A0A8J3QKZ3_9ACTN|nr:hypothetical protein Rhe02_98010 [Rhizocola hellebori]
MPVFFLDDADTKVRTRAWGELHKRWAGIITKVEAHSILYVKRVLINETKGEDLRRSRQVRDSLSEVPNVKYVNARITKHQQTFLA